MAGRPTIALCMIVRDEEEHLVRCLDSVTGAVDEIVVVDTGSVDRTVEIARRFGATVVEHPWNDHFSDARNAGIDAAESDWILVLDADEALAESDRDVLRRLAADPQAEAYTVLCQNRMAQDAPPVTINRSIRLFRNRPGHRYSGRIHETVTAQLPQDRIVAADVRIDHYGYDPRTRATRSKSERNLALLEREAAEEAPNAFTEMNLGNEHAALGDHERAVAHFERAAELLGDATPMYAKTLAWRRITSLRQLGRYDEAIVVARQATAWLPRFTDLFYEWAQTARAAGDLDEAERLARHCLALGDAPPELGGIVGAGSFRAASVLAGVLLDRGDPASAEEAEQLLLSTLAEHADHVAAILPLVGAQLRRGVAPADVEAAVAAVTPLTAEVRLELAVVFRETGAKEAAAEQLRAIARETPRAAIARLAEAELALDEGRWDDAAAQAARVDHASPYGAEGAVTEAVAHLLRDDHDAARAAVDAATSLGAPLEASTLLRAWLGDEDGPLPDTALALLVLTFERALAAGDVDHAVALLPLFERISGLAARQRREVLALVYLRHGLLDSAADEWAAALQEHGPDSAGLLGMARVAAARGDADDARTFAEGALELDPGSAGARALLEALGN